jgi:hypothetical protein
MACVRAVGARVRLALPHTEGVLEISVDTVRPEGVGLVFALSGGLEFDGALDEVTVTQCPE